MNLKTYQAVERGRRVGRVDTLCMLAEYFDTTVDYLTVERFMSINMKIPTFIRLQKCLLITENIS